MAVTREVAIAELKRRGIVPHHCVDGEDYEYDPYFEGVDDEEGNPLWAWKEPIPGPYTGDRFRFGGLHTVNEDGIPYYDHGGCMVEIHRRHGIEFHLARVIFSQPYDPLDRLHSSVEVVRDSLDLEMTIVEDLAWWNTTTTLCVYKPITTISFREFCRTFRYWLITNVIPSPVNRVFELREGVLPNEVTPPLALFFDFISCCNRSSVVLGLHHGTVDDAWAELPMKEFIEYDTFVFLWNAYRASLCTTPILMALLFVSRLRARVADRATYAPGGENHLRLVSEWAAMAGEETTHKVGNAHQLQ